jgi:hypothetical protein
MKAQTSIESATPIYPENWNVPAAPLTFRDHYSGPIWQIRACKYLLERYQSYLQLLCRLFCLNLYVWGQNWVKQWLLVQDRLCPKGQNWTEKIDVLKSSSNLKVSWAIFHFWPNCSLSSVLKQNLTLAPQPNPVSKFLAEFCSSILLSSRYNLGSAYLRKLCKGASETWESTYEFGFQCLLDFHFEDGRNFELPKSLHTIQIRISAATVNFQRS